MHMRTWGGGRKRQLHVCRWAWNQYSLSEYVITRDTTNLARLIFSEGIYAQSMLQTLATCLWVHEKPLISPVSKGFILHVNIYSSMYPSLLYSVFPRKDRVKRQQLMVYWTSLTSWRDPSGGSGGGGVRGSGPPPLLCHDVGFLTFGPKLDPRLAPLFCW